MAEPRIGHRFEGNRHDQALPCEAPQVVHGGQRLLGFQMLQEVNGGDDIGRPKEANSRVMSSARMSARIKLTSANRCRA